MYDRILQYVPNDEGESFDVARSTINRSVDQNGDHLSFYDNFLCNISDSQLSSI